jgi:hypothetical protein
MQWVMTIADPKAGEVNIAALLDDSFVKKADSSGISIVLTAANNRNYSACLIRSSCPLLGTASQNEPEAGQYTF